MKKVSHLFQTILIMSLLSGCVAVFNNPDSGSSSTQSAEGSSTSTSSGTVSFDSFAKNNRVGWLKYISGTCSNSNTTVTVSITGGNGSSGSATCTSGTFSLYLDTSAELTGTLTLTATHEGGTATTTLNKRTNVCDTVNARDNTYADGMASGSGTFDDPYFICTADQLTEIANGRGDTYRLGNDIYFLQGDTNGDGTVDGSDNDYVTGNGWAPVEFYGEFEGDHFGIFNLTINRSTTDQIALFFLNSSSPALNSILRISRLHMVSVDIVGQNWVGSLYANTGNASAVFDTISVSGSVEGDTGVGGLFNGGSSGVANTVINSTSSATVTCNGSNCGGLVGYSRGFNGWSSSATGVVNGQANAGGFIGQIQDGFVRNCYSTGNVSGTTQVGGFVGYADLGSGGTEVLDSYATGDVEGSGVQVGGFVGYGWNVLANVANSFATGNVTSTSADTSIGPFIGGPIAAGADPYYYSGATCSNSGAGSCNSIGTAVATLSDFYSTGNAPLSSWDFTYNWTENSGSLPTLWFDSSYTISTSMSGEGIFGSPYLIESDTHLDSIRSHPYFMGAYFKIDNGPIDLSGLGATFNRIADLDTARFYGVINGNSQTISNMTISAAGEDYVGLFSYGASAHVYDLTLSNVDVDAANYVGGLTGYLRYGLIVNVSVSGDVDGTGTDIGGMLGFMTGLNGSLHTHSQLSSSATVSGTQDVGGLVGTCRVAIEQSSATGNVSETGAAVGNFGGFVGAFLGVGNFSNNFATGNVTAATSTNVGGFAGTIGGGDSANSNVYAIGDVSGADNVGGFVGYIYASSARVLENTYAAGNVTGTGADVGGFVGEVDNNWTIRYGFANGTVQGNDGANVVGLFVGNDGGSTFTSNYVLDTQSCTNSGAGNCNSSNYTGQNPISYFYDSTNAPMTGNWDFGSVWQDNSGTSDYPTFQ